jgi:hypothetical protein
MSTPVSDNRCQDEARRTTGDRLAKRHSGISSKRRPGESAGENETETSELDPTLELPNAARSLHQQAMKAYRSPKGRTGAQLNR